jgi:rRNA maturation protein Nop10
MNAKLKRVRRIRCPKCGKLAETKRPPRVYPDGNRYSMYVHAQENRGGFIVVTDHCLVAVQS